MGITRFKGSLTNSNNSFKLKLEILKKRKPELRDASSNYGRERGKKITLTYIVIHATFLGMKNYHIKSIGE